MSLSLRNVVSGFKLKTAAVDELRTPYAALLKQALAAKTMNGAWLRLPKPAKAQSCFIASQLRGE